MPKLNQYISLTLLKSIGLVLLFLIGLGLFMNFVAESRDIGKGDYGVFLALRYVLLTFPNELYQLFPAAGLLGCLLGLGWLAHHHELVAMRAAGLSIWQISKIVLRIAIVLSLFVTLLAEWLNPFALHAAQVEKTLAKSGGQALATAHGLWVRERDAFIHIQTVINSENLTGVTIYRFTPTFQLQEATFAKKASYASHQWQLQDVSQSFLTTNRITTSHQAQTPWNIRLDPTILKVATQQPQEMSLSKLYHYLNYLETNHLRDHYYNYVFWSRILQPLTTVVMVLLAIPFIFGPLREVSLGLRILTGIVIGFAFHLSQNFLGPLSVVYQVPPLLASCLPLLVFGTLGSYWIRRLR